jgi:transcriptional regulator
MEAARQEGAAANATARQGVAAMDYRAAEANETAREGVAVMENQAAMANETASHGVAVMENQAAMANETARHGVTVLENEARILNTTLEANLGSVASNMDKVSEVIVEQFDRLSDPLALVACLIGPLQILTGMNAMLAILQTLNLIKGTQGRLVHAAQVGLEKLTGAVEGVRDEI